MAMIASNRLENSPLQTLPYGWENPEITNSLQIGMPRYFPLPSLRS